ncbi:membrane protein [Streptomyces hygroscopicus]|uniref:hypothetical protein n=1 Tax=Streptomyces hygroscopicus TaxID=1912 RepID=UPI0022408601|nr:hypothetical protein [Streptomyces hygroscopicus]MCW7943795.1 membrane protein [Streptomyces hygroscopicus]
MLALRLARGARPLVQLRRLLVTAASAGTGFLLLCTLGYALGHPGASATSTLRLAWCLAPVAATVYFAVAVARTDPGTRPRSGLAAIGLGPVRLMALSAVTTALSTALGSLLALLLFLHLRGGPTGLPFVGPTAGFLAADQSLPLPAALTLLALVPLAASLASALALRPADALLPRAAHGDAQAASGTDDATDAQPGDLRDQAPLPDLPTAPRPTPGGLPWGVAALAAGLAVETQASRSDGAPGLRLPGGVSGGPATVLAGWALTALGLALAGPALAHLCGHLLQAVRPGAVRLLAGRGLQEEARRIGRPLGVVCAVASGAYVLATQYAETRPSFGPLTTLGAVLVAGCTVATLATAALEARQARADTLAALGRLGAPTTMLRTAALLRAGALVVVFAPLTWAVAVLAAMPAAG